MAQGVDIDKLRALLEVLVEQDISEFEHEDEALRIRVVRGARMQQVAMPMMAAAAAAAPAARAATTSEAPVSSQERGPDADSYVEVGDSVDVGQTVCIIEAMKLMNEIEAEVRGRVAQISVENGQPVEYGQTLFLIDPQG